MSISDSRQAGPPIPLINGGSTENEGDFESYVKRRVPVCLSVMADELGLQISLINGGSTEDEGDFESDVKRRVPVCLSYAGLLILLINNYLEKGNFESDVERRVPRNNNGHAGLSAYKFDGGQLKAYHQVRLKFEVC